MTQIGIRALKQNASAVVARAAAGETVIITDRGRPVAQLVPSPARRVEQLLAAGRIRPPRRTLAELPPPARRKRGQPRIGEVLTEMRATERE